MAILPMRRNPLTSMLNFAAERDREAASLGSVISQIAKPVLGSMGVQTDEMTPQPAVMRGPVPAAQPLGPMTGPAPAPTLVDARETPGLQPRVTELLAGLESAYGQPLNVTSGYRSPERNAAVGGAKNSQHMHGNAVDIDVSGMSTDERRKLIELAQAQGFTGIGIYDNSLHFDTGAERAWGPSYSRDSVPSWAADLVGGGGDATAMGGAGADRLGGNVEDILAQLYPQMSPEEEKKQRRKDFFAAASQGLSALSQGRPQDFSNIRQMQEQRRTQAVQDMRERERARAGAAMILDQGGSPALATAFATGAASMSDYFTDRQIRQAQETADKQKLLDAQRAKLLVPYLEAAGIPEDRIAEIVAFGEEGGDVTELLTFEQTAAAAEKAREVEAAQEELGQEFVNSDDPAMRMVGRLVQSGVAIKDAIDSTTKLFPQAGGTKEFADLARAQAIVDAGVINPTDGKPFSSAGAVLGFEMLQKQATGAGPQATVTWNSDGSMTITPAAPAAAAPAAAAPAAAAPAAAAPAAAAPAAGGAPVGVGGAFSQRFGGMETGIPAGAPAPAPIAAGQTLPLDVAIDAANLEDTIAQTAQRRQELEVARDTAQDDIARATAERQLAELGVQQAQLNLQAAQASAEPDAALKSLAVQQAEEALIAAQLANEKARQDAEGAEDEAATEEEKAVRRQLRAQQSTDTVMREGAKLLSLTQDWKSGVVPGLIATGARLLSQSETGRAERLLGGIKDNIALDNLIAMKQDSPTGGALGSVSNAEGERLERRFGTLDVTGNTTDLRDNVGAAMNAYNDAIHGTPQQILKLFEEGKITAEEADAYSTRLVSSLDRDMATIMTENGPATNLGLSNNRDTIYGLATPLSGEEPGLTQEERDLFETFKQ